MKHELKVQPQFWDAIADGSNPSNIRRDDRKFRIGDICELKRYDPSHGFTGQSVEKVITHILMPEDFPNGLPAGYVILGFGKPDNADAALAIAEHAFTAGYNVGYDDGYGNGGAPKWHAATGVQKAWSDYDPPEDLKALS